MLSWCNKMGLLLNSPKSVTFDNIFDFVISESCDGVVSYSHNTWVLILLIIFFIFAIVSKLLIPTKNTYHNPQPPLLPQSLVRSSQKISAITAMMATDAAGHHDCNFSCGSPFWLLRLHRWVIPPSNNAGLFDCCEWRGGGYLAGCASHNTAQTVQELKN